MKSFSLEISSVDCIGERDSLPKVLFLGSENCAFTARKYPYKKTFLRISLDT